MAGDGEAPRHEVAGGGSGGAAVSTGNDARRQGHDPLAPLAFEAPPAAIKQSIAAGERLFENLIERQLTGNPHRVTVLLRPDPGQAESENRAERARLTPVGFRSKFTSARSRLEFCRWTGWRLSENASGTLGAARTDPVLDRGGRDRQARLAPSRGKADSSCSPLVVTCLLRSVAVGRNRFFDFDQPDIACQQFSSDKLAVRRPLRWEVLVSDFCYSYPILNRVLAQAEQMDMMMAAIGADPLLAIRRDHGSSWYEARTRCIDCAVSRQCRDWLEDVDRVAAKDAPAFCPNHDFFLDCRHQGRGALPTAA